MGSVQTAEDVTQECFLALFAGAAFDPKLGSLRTYLFGIARHLAMRRVRIEERESEEPAADAAAPCDTLGELIGQERSAVVARTVSDASASAKGSSDSVRVRRLLAGRDRANRGRRSGRGEGAAVSRARDVEAAIGAVGRSRERPVFCKESSVIDDDKLRSVLREWEAPQPSPAMDARVRAAWRGAHRPAWKNIWTARVSIPVPAMAVLLLAAAFPVGELRRISALHGDCAFGSRASSDATECDRLSTRAER